MLETIAVILIILWLLASGFGHLILRGRVNPCPTGDRNRGDPDSRDPGPTLVARQITGTFEMDPHAQAAPHVPVSVFAGRDRYVGLL
jgi:hypothetical protein